MNARERSSSPVFFLASDVIPEAAAHDGDEDPHRIAGVPEASANRSAEEVQHVHLRIAKELAVDGLPEERLDRCELLQVLALHVLEPWS